MNRTIRIGDRHVGPGHPTYVIAEMSGNHNGDKDKALALVRAAADAGADAVKLQTYTADTITLDSDKEYFQVKSGTLWDGQTLHSLYREAFTPWDWQPELKALAEELGMQCFSSPFDATAIDFLETMNVAAYKIASFELVDLGLIRKAASTGKPLIMSTGMATLSEIGEAVNVARDAGCKSLALLRTNSAYPAPPEEMHLRTIPHL
ncbi:MAG: N-acetylneuraminate synthase family protein, partial [Myxococcota bacterium]